MNRLAMPFVHIVLLIVTIAAPFLFPAYQTQLATLWLFIIVSLTWDMTGGQMGYNSLGNIFFYGTGMYVAAVIGAGIFCAICAYIIGYLTFGLRGPYFAIGTLGVAIAAGELVSNWEWVGGGQGISMPNYPGEQERLFIYYAFAAVGVILYIFLRWLYQTRFAAAINAIRDDEEKAEAMGIHTMRYKLAAWAMSAFFVGVAGAISAFQLLHFEPLETAYQTINLGIFMVVCVLLGGKGTLWGPIIGAIMFHVFKEVTWNYFLGWQWVALGALIVVTVVYFQDGLMGWLAHKKPEWFGIRVDNKDTSAEPTAIAEATQ